MNKKNRERVYRKTWNLLSAHRGPKGRKMLARWDIGRFVFSNVWAPDYADCLKIIQRALDRWMSWGVLCVEGFKIENVDGERFGISEGFKGKRMPLHLKREWLKAPW